MRHGFTIRGNRLRRIFEPALPSWILRRLLRRRATRDHEKPKPTPLRTQPESEGGGGGTSNRLPGVPLEGRDSSEKLFQCPCALRGGCDQPELKCAHREPHKFYGKETNSPFWPSCRAFLCGAAGGELLRCVPAADELADRLKEAKEDGVESALLRSPLGSKRSPLGKNSAKKSMKIVL